MKRVDLGPDWGALGVIEGQAQQLQALELESPQIEGRRAFVAVDWDGHRHLLVPLAGELHVSPAERGSGIEVATRDLIDGSDTHRFLDVVCLKPHLNGLFDVVASDILMRCAESSLEQVPVACRGVLERWRELLEQVSTGQLQTSVLVGAWGELWFVRALLAIGAPWHGLWTGPAGSVHDIAGASGTQLEVKSTLSRGSLVVEIHGIGQLDCAADELLLLGVLRLERDDSNGKSIADLVHDCVNVGANHAEVAAGLAQVGVTSGAPEFEASRFAVTDSRLYEVDAAFPRLVPSSLVAGALASAITGLAYQLDLTTDSPMALSDEGVKAMLRRMAGVGS